MLENSSLELPKSIYEKIIAIKCKFIITGASGWVGKALLESLYFYFKDDLQKNVIAISNSSSKITLRNGYEIKTCGYDFEVNENQKYIMCHFAFLTKDKVSMMSDEEYHKQNQQIRNNVTKIIIKTKPFAILYSSSGAVYNQKDPYGILKLKDESYFSDLAKEVGSKIIIPRIFNIAGPYINKHNIYALSDFIVQLKNRGKIVINANFPVIRSYIHIVDLFRICFSWIFDDKNSEKSLIFDTGNYEEIELVDLAKMIVKLINPDGKIIRENYDPNRIANNYVGDIQIEKMLCKKYDVILTSYEQIILDTYKYLNMQLNEK